MRAVGLILTPRPPARSAGNNGGADVLEKANPLTGLPSPFTTIMDVTAGADSSRFWEAESWAPGKSQPSFDKQFLRDWLTNSGWDKKSPPPELPAEIVEKTASRYLDAYERITGTKF
jgi:hypothetical protein